MNILTKAAILAADDLKTEVVSVPEWGGEVLVSVMTGTARDEYENSIIDIDSNGKAVQNLTNVRAKLLAATIVDESGNLLFNETDIAALGRKSSAALDRLFSAAQKLNAVSDEELEEIAKN